MVVKGLQVEWGACFRIVPFDYTAKVLACWKDLVAAGLGSGGIIVLDAITGVHASVLSGHISSVRSLAFSLDGTLLVSGSDDRTIKLWDIQTGGVIHTYHQGNTIYSVSISPDCTTIASAYYAGVYLWDAQTGMCHHVTGIRAGGVNCVGFSPMNSKLSMSATSNNHPMQQWNVEDYQIGPTYQGDGIAFSSDGACLILWRGAAATIRNSDSGVVITKFQVSNGSFECCCFSPNGKFVAGSVSSTIYVWDITSSDTHLIGTFIGHTSPITSLAFSSSLMSSSNDRSVRFWQVGTSSSNPTATNLQPTFLHPIEFVSLQSNNGIAISWDGDGVVRTWDILTGHCKSSFHTPFKGSNHKDAQLVNGKTIFVWYSYGGIVIWDTERSEIQTVDAPCYKCLSLRISGDGSKVFLLDHKSI